MASGGPGASRAFVQKLPKGHALEIRNQTAQELKGDHGTSIEKAAAIGQLIGRSSVTSMSSISAISGSTTSGQGSFLHPGSVNSFSSGTVTFGDVSVVEPLDYEEYVQQQRRGRQNFGIGSTGTGAIQSTDPAQTLIDFPSDDIEVSIIPRKIRTMGHVLPEEKLDTLDPIVQNCVECYKSDWVVVKRRYQQYSSSVRTREELELGQDETLPRQEFELDDTPEPSPEADHALFRRGSLRSSIKARHWQTMLVHNRMQLSVPNSRRVSMMSLDDSHVFPRTLSMCSFKMEDTRSLNFEIFGNDDFNEEGERTPTNERSQSPVGTPLGELSSSDESLSKAHENSFARLLEEISLPIVMKEKNDKFRNGSDQGTPRGSWASFDLRNSQPDAPVAGLLDVVNPDTVDSLNELKRSEKRPKKIFSLYPHQPESEMTERRFPAKVPQENVRHRILVQCNKLQLPLEIEPMFASMALYDAKEKKKISENFYFDMNPDKIKAMLNGQPDTTPIELSTLARSCVFNISVPSNDLFLVVKLEKVLQGDINDAVEPYLKEMPNLDKPKANAFDACNRLGRYRMPFAWTAIWLQNIIKGKDTLQERDSGSDAESTASNSLDRKSSTSSFEQFRKNAKVSTGTAGDSSSLTRKGSLDRKDKRSSWTSSSGLTTIESTSSAVDIGNLLDTFPPVTLTVSSFFKQEPDKLRDEDLYKFLQELKRSSPIQKRLKCIRATLKLDISVAPEQTKYCFTPELAKFIPFPDMKTRPTKEVLEFSPRETFVPNYQFRNLLYVSPKDVNFANRSGERARNIAVKIQFMEEDGMKGMKTIFGKSSCPEFTNEVYSAVTYHNKSPDFYEEVKIKLPSNLREYHHILFSFYHISCQGQRREQHTLETPVGYTWIQIFRDGSLQTGLFELPVMLDPPSAEIRRQSTDVAPAGTKWIDNKKPIFTVEIQAASTVHPLDPALDRFFMTTAPLQLGNLSSQHQAKIEKITEESLIKKIREISNARLEPLVRFLPLVLDKLLLLVVKPPNFGPRMQDVGQAAFNAIAEIVNKISKAHELQDRNDRHGRNDLLTTYIHWQAHLPHPDFRPDGSRKGSGTKTNDPSMVVIDDDSLRSIGDCDVAGRAGRSMGQYAKLVHEQLAFQWSESQGLNRDSALSAAWFFLELTIKAMVEHLATTSRLNTERKKRFSDQFHDDVINLTSSVTADIIQKASKPSKVFDVERLNSSLAFFLHDLLSVMDRGFVFSLIRTYMKDMTAKINSLNESVQLWNLQLEFTRIITSHEHYVALSLPLSNPSADSTSDFYSGASSPTPSIRSTDSQSSFISHLTEKSHWAELTPDFRRKHFLTGIVLTHLSNAFDHQKPEVHYKAVNLIRNLLTSHDFDPRYNATPHRSRVANLYLPLVAVIIDNLSKLHSWTVEGESRIVGGNNPNEHLNLILNVISDNLPNAKGPIVFKEHTTRNLLLCFLWVLKNVEKSVLKQWWTELPHNRLLTLLEVLRITLSCFQYRSHRKKRQPNSSLFASEPALNFLFGRKGGSPARSETQARTPDTPEKEFLPNFLVYQGRRGQRRHMPLTMRKSSDMKSKLEDMIVGPGSNRHEFLQRNSRRSNMDRFPSSPIPDGNRRWHKASFLRNTQQGGDSLSLSGFDVSSSNAAGCYISDTEYSSQLEGNLANEASMLVLDTLELIVKVVPHIDHSQGLLASVLRVLLHALGTNQSTSFLQHLFAVQRSFVFKFPSLLFDEASEHCADLCLRLLKHCSSSIGAVRSQASASLYLLMRQNFEIGNNFARVKMQVTTSLSSLVGTSDYFNEEYLRKSLKTILVYAQDDHELSDTTFPEQVQDLVFNLHMILSDTVKMKEYADDHEMHMDLMYRIAKGYQNSPDLRLTWLESMATKHENLQNFAEAAMCKIHSAALISEYLHMKEDKQYMPIGAVTFSALTPNALEESAVSDDVVSPDEEGICTGKFFTETGLLQFLDDSAKLFSKAGMYEAVNGVFKASIPIAEANRNFTKLGDIHKELMEAFRNIDRLKGKRIFGTYFRVGFYGPRFGDLDGDEYIYKEKPLAKLPEIAHKLESFYSEKFGKDNLIIIKDSKNVEVGKLNADKAYIQVTYVEPYFENFELRERVTTYEKNFNIERFIFATPFTPDGNPHGELHEQFKRKTILKTANFFPYVKTRIQVVDRKQIVLTPIEVAIEDVQKKIAELESAINQVPPDPKILQMVLQGCIGTTVNQGPIEVANVFLGDLFDGKKTPTKHQDKLRLCFKDLAKKSEDALKKNRKLIATDQKEYQSELEKNYRHFEDHLSPLFSLNHSGGPSKSTSSSENPKVTSPMV